MKKYIVENYEAIIQGKVWATSPQSALSTAKTVYPHVIAPMVYEEVKK